MPSEIRHLIFTEDEVMVALRLFQEQRQGIPIGPGMNVSYLADPDVSAEMRCSDGVTRDFDSAQIAAALMLQCNRDGIVLPKAATKALSLADGQMLLTLELNEASAQASSLKPFEVFTDRRG